MKRASERRRGSGGGRRRTRWPLLLLVCVGAGSSVAMYGGAFAGEAPRTRTGEAGLEAREIAPRDPGELLARARAVDAGLDAAEQYIESHVAPIERVLLNYRRDPELVRRVAVALVKEANRVGIEPRLLLAVMLVENPWVDPSARSPVGAVGLMQVMPLHRGGWSQCGDGSLEDVETNICYGAQIFANLYRAEGDADRALLRYNGCVRGTNTPDCHRYPYHVYARAGRASVLAWLGRGGGGAASP